MALPGPVHRIHLVALLGSAAVAACGFLPWVRLGDVGLSGVPDPAGLFVVAAGACGVALSALALRSRRDYRQLLLLVGLAALTTLAVVWRTGPSTIAERAEARAQAIAMVDSVPAPAVPPVRAGVGLYVGLAGALATAAAGLTVLRD